MLRLVHRFGGRPVVVAGVLLLMAGGGAAYAAKGGNFIGPDGIIHGCVSPSGFIAASETASCKQNETPLFWNQQGIQGPAGAPGAKGDKGDKGDRGPSDAYANTSGSVSVAGLTTVAAVTLPAGSYVVQAVAAVSNIETATKASCSLVGSGATVSSVSSAGTYVPGQGYGSIPLLGSVTVAAGSGTVSLVCSSLISTIMQGTVLATQVGALHTS